MDFQTLKVKLVIILGLLLSFFTTQGLSNEIPSAIATNAKQFTIDVHDLSLDYVDDFLTIPAFFPGDTMSIAFGDLNNDGLMDAVVGTLNYSINVTNQNKVYWNNGDGTWTEADELGYSGAWAVDLADFNGDGYLDVMVGNYGSFLGPVQDNFLFINTEDPITNKRTFVSYQRFGAGNTTNANIMDVNSDGFPDVVVPNAAANYIYLHNHEWK